MTGLLIPYSGHDEPSPQSRPSASGRSSPFDRRKCEIPTQLANGGVEVKERVDFDPG